MGQPGFFVFSLVPTLRVGMLHRTLRVRWLRDAERPKGIPTRSVGTSKIMTVESITIFYKKEKIMKTSQKVEKGCPAPVPVRVLCIFLHMIFFLSSFPALAAPVPDTGQTKCYNNTAEIPCPKEGEDFYGQDGNYAIKARHTYTKLKANGVEWVKGVDPDSAWIMTRDDSTGLVWEMKQNKNAIKDYTNHHDADNTYTWYDTNPATNGGYAGTHGNGITTFDTKQFINNLNAANYGGYSDWRIPSIEELLWIVNDGLDDPSIDVNFFPNTVSSYYWSSITDAYRTDYARYVDFFSGSNVFISNKSSSCYVRAVRSGQSGAFDNLLIKGDSKPVVYTRLKAIGVEWKEGVDLDNDWIMTRDDVTGLIWEKNQ